MNSSPLFLASSLSAAMAGVRGATRPEKAYFTWPREDGSAGTLSWSEAGARVDAWGRRFAAWKLAPGDRVLVASRDDGAVATAALACFTYGMSAVVADASGTGAETAPLLRLANAAASIVDAPLLLSWNLGTPARGVALENGVPAGEVAPASSSWASRLLRRTPAAATSEAPAPPVPADIPDSAEAYVLFTSGSTSRPKGVCISRGALLAHLRTLVRQLRHDEDSRVLDPLPLHHTDGLTQGPILAWLAGATCLRPMRFEVSTIEQFCASVYRERVTHVVAVPTMLAILLENSKGLEDTFESSEFRTVVSTGGFLDERIWARFQDTFRTRVANVYGLTETVTGGCFAGPDDETRRVGTVGKPVDCEIAVTDDAGHPVAAGTPGELRMRGAHVMIGYLNDPEATSAVLRDGWLRTGDLATRDAEGFVRIVGRLKSVVISGGQNIQPEEVDDVLRGIPGVRDAVTFGIPDPRFGEILVGCVESIEGSGLTEGMLFEGCRGVISAYKVPRTLILVERLPRGPAGKVTVPAARQLFEEARLRSSAAVPASGGGDLARRVLELAAQVFHITPDRLVPSSSPVDTPGWDSFGHLAFVEALEGAFGLRLVTREVMSLRSIADAVRLVRARLGEGSR